MAQSLKNDELKYCGSCGRFLPREKFYLMYKDKNIRHSTCKDCQKEAVLIRTRELSKKVKRLVIEHYGGRCVCCGEGRIEFLTLHHPKDDGQEQHEKLTGHKRTGGYVFYKKLIEANYPSDFELEVLCWNCNCALAYYGYCPHSANQV